MKRLLFGALCASVLVLAAALLPVAPAGAAVPAPGVPTNVSVVAGGSQVTISWSAPTSGPTPTKYQVAGTSASPVCSAVTTTSCTITFPPTKPASTAGMIVKYKVRAFNGTKAGPYSAQILTLFGKPTTPTGITVEPRMAGVYVHWNLSTGGKYPVTGYTATASNGNTCTAILGDWCTVPGLTNGTAYNFTVTATNAVGTSAPSAVSSNVFAGSPRAPTSPVAVAAPLSADVTFTPAGSNGFAISSYTLTAHDLTDPLAPATHWANATSPLHISGLTSGHTYNFTVSATNINGEGPESTPSNPVTLPTAPDAPTGVTAVAAAYSADVSFTAPFDGNSPITNYTVTAHDVSNPGSASDGTAWGGSSSPIHKPSLQAGHTYTFTVSALNAVGPGPDSAASNEVTIPQPPDAPTDLVATAGVNDADISFTLPSDNGSTIGYYVITVHDVFNPSDPKNGFMWAYYGSPIHIAGLTTGETYNFTLSAANAIGQGPESAPSNAVVVL